jgi:hypothetical protein
MKAESEGELKAKKKKKKGRKANLVSVSTRLSKTSDLSNSEEACQWPHCELKLWYLCHHWRPKHVAEPRSTLQAVLSSDLKPHEHTIQQHEKTNKQIQQH